MIDFISHSEEETLFCAAAFAATLKPGDVVALEGPLGAGKTLFCRGVVKAMGYQGIVNSPTYALVNEYAARIPVYHMDLYRLAPGSDWEQIGLGHYLNAEGVCLIEWPERLPPERLPPERRRFTHRVNLEVAGETRRRIRIENFGA